MQTDITVAVDGIIQRQWKFELSFLDREHPAALCWNCIPGEPASTSIAKPFRIVEVTELLDTIPEAAGGSAVEDGSTADVVTDSRAESPTDDLALRFSRLRRDQ